MLRLLARAFDITALCFERSATAGNGVSSDVARGGNALGGFADVEVFPIPQRHSRLRWAWDHLRSAALGQVYTTYLYGSAGFQRRLIELLQGESFDLVHVDSLDLSGYLPACRGLPAVCVHHDIQSALLRRRAGVESTVWRRLYLRYQAGLTQREERRWSDRIALNVTVSERDAALLRRLVPAARLAIVPNGVDVEEFHPDEGGAGRGVAFAGGAVPFPNADALAFFCTEVLPHLRAGDAKVPVRWIGRATAEQRRYYGERYGVELTGYVDDVRPFMREAACHIVPLRAGGGTRLKILNSWAMGKAVVSTSVGCEGLAAVDGENILIRDDPKEFAEAALAVLEDGEVRRRLGERGRATAERLYSWDVVGRQMIEAYLRVAGAPSGEEQEETRRVGAEPRYRQP